MILCVAGRGWARVGTGEPRVIERDSAVWIPAGKTHGYGADPQDSWTIQWVHFRDHEVEAYARVLDLCEDNFVLPLPDGAIGQLAFAEIYERLEEDYTIPNLLVASARLRLVLSELCRRKQRPGGEANAGATDRAIQWMRQHLRERPNFPFLAHLAGMSVPHFTVLFRRRTGYSLFDYFLRLKIQRACRLLDTTTLRIAEIAAAVGMADPFYFSRRFRSVMSRSPREYRAAAKG